MRTPLGAQAPLDLIDAKAICWRDSELTPARKAAITPAICLAIFAKPRSSQDFWQQEAL
jgi:hypothetical protein